MTISSQTRKAGPYTGNGSTTTFPFAFKVFVNSDVLVVRTNLSGVETILTLGTDYTVSLNADQNSNAGGNVVLPTALTSGFLLTIASKVPLLQQTDLTNQGGFYPAVLNASLDRLTILTQQLNEEVGRSAKLPISSAADADTLTAAILQLANDQTNIDAVAGDLSNINTVAGNTTNINTVAGVSSNVTTVAGIASDVTAVAGNATNITAVKNNATNINTVAGIAANVTTVAGISANVTSVAGNATNINTNATNITAIQNASTNATNAANSATAAAASASAASTSETNAASSAAAAAASAASGMYSAVQDKSANYTVVAGDAGDLIRVSTGSGAVTLTLPTIGATGIVDGFKIAVVKWTSDSNQVTVQRAGSNTINGATSVTIGQQYSQIIFVADAETSTWFASQSGLGATNMNVDVFSGNASTTAFTLSADPSNKNNTNVFIGGVYQAKSTYSVSGTTLTFSSAPPSGTNNIEVEYGTPLAIGTPSDDTVSTAKLQAGAVTPAKMSTGAPTWDTSGNMSLPISAKQTIKTGSVNFDLKPNAGAADYVSIQATYSGTTKEGVNVDYLGRVAIPQGQLQFPATQNPSSDANTLDDYEEGTWTPVLAGVAGGTGTGTIGSLTAWYIKIGKLVTIYAYASGVLRGTASGSIGFTGLPFAVVTSGAPGTYSGAALSYWSSFTTGIVNATAYVTSASSVMELHANAVANTVNSPMQASLLPTTGGAEIIFTITYQTAT